MIEKARRAIVGGVAVGALAFTTLGLAPNASAAGAPVNRRAVEAVQRVARDHGPAGCEVKYKTSRSLRWKYVKATNECDWGQRCVKIRTGIKYSLGYWDRRTSGPYWIDPGATLSFRYGGGRTLLAVTYCD